MLMAPCQMTLCIKTVFCTLRLGIVTLLLILRCYFRSCLNENGSETCEGASTETKSCDHPACECVFDMERFRELFGFDSNKIVGYIERDGESGMTPGDKFVFTSTEVNSGDVVHVDCNNW